MSYYIPSRAWGSQARRRRILTLAVTLSCAVALSVLLYSTSALVKQADVGIQKRNEPLQEPLINTGLREGFDLNIPASKPEHISDDQDNSDTTRKIEPESLGGGAASQVPIAEVNPTWLQIPDTSAFPAFEKYAAVVEKVANLPDLVYLGFEDAVIGDTLAGWEAEWVVNGTYDTQKWGLLKEPRIDFVYTWVNGSDPAFRRTKHPYELNSTLNDADGQWIGNHGENRYRDWNELKYSVRSVERYAPFRNKIQILVNALTSSENEGTAPKQVPTWLDEQKTADILEVLAQEDFFEDDKLDCLPTFNSLTIENQIHNTDSGVDKLFALSDDMLLGRPHAASDIYSPLFGPLFAFKTNTYNTLHRPNEADSKRFGEKPWLIYTSWLLNRRFGARKRKGQAHFGHSLSRKVMSEVMKSFPGPEVSNKVARRRSDTRNNTGSLR